VGFVQEGVVERLEWEWEEILGGKDAG